MALAFGARQHLAGNGGSLLLLDEGDSPPASLTPRSDQLASAREPCETLPVRERATLRLDSGDELRVEVERDELSRDEIVVHRAVENGRPVADGLLAAIDEHLATAEPHPAGTTDRLLAADRERPY